MRNYGSKRIARFASTTCQGPCSSHLTLKLCAHLGAQRDFTLGLVFGSFHLGQLSLKKTSSAFWTPNGTWPGYVENLHFYHCYPCLALNKLPLLISIALEYFLNIHSGCLCINPEFTSVGSWHKATFFFYTQITTLLNPHLPRLAENWSILSS